MNPIHDNQGNLIGIEMHQTRISAEALAQMAARVAALEGQVAECQQANTKLIAQVVELEHERDEARTTIRIARQRLYDAHGSVPAKVAEVIRAVGGILRRDDDPAGTPVPPPMPIEDALSSVASQLAVMIIQERLAAGHTITFAGDDAPLRAQEPGRLCDHCGLPLVSAHIADEVRMELAGRRISAHRVCADYLRDREGWAVVATTRGGRVMDAGRELDALVAVGVEIDT